jgi:hypothetical protein
MKKVVRFLLIHNLYKNNTKFSIKNIKYGKIVFFNQLFILYLFKS